MSEKYKKSNFASAFFFLKKEQRHALSVIYEFSREADDAADEQAPLNEKIKKLEYLKENIKNIYTGKKAKEVLFINISEIIKRYKIPEYVFLKLLQAMEKDINGVDIKDRKELEEYMFSVAGVIGIAVLKISEYNGNDLEEISIHTGNAVQMTNILRDIKDDIKIKRVYIPEQDRIRFLGTREIDFNSNKFNLLFKYEKQVAQKYYENANMFFSRNKSKKLLAAIVMKNLYYEILKELNFDNIEKNHKISNYKKIKAILKSIKEIF